MNYEQFSTVGSTGGDQRKIEKKRTVVVSNEEINSSHPDWLSVVSSVDKGSSVKVQTEKTGVREGKVKFVNSRNSNGKVSVTLQQGAYGYVIAVTSASGINGYRDVTTSVTTKEAEEIRLNEIKKKQLEEENVFWEEEKQWQSNPSSSRTRMCLKQKFRNDDLEALNQEFYRFKSAAEIEQIYDLLGCNKEATAEILFKSRKQFNNMTNKQKREFRNLLNELLNQN